MLTINDFVPAKLRQQQECDGEASVNMDAAITDDVIRNSITVGEGLKKLAGCRWTARRQDGLNGMYHMLT